MPKYSWKTLSAAGAATLPPWPPFSTSAQTTSSGSSNGPVAAPQGLVDERRGRPARQDDRLLGGARLAGDVDREAAEHRGGGAVRAVGGEQQALLDDRERLRVDARRLRMRGHQAAQDRRRALGAVGGLLDVHPEVRGDEPAAVRDHRVEAGELERRHEQVLLADGELHGVAGLPELVHGVVERPLAPLGRRQQAGRLGADLDPGRLAEPEARGPFLERVPSLRQGGRRTSFRPGRSRCRTRPRGPASASSAGRHPGSSY